MKAEDVRAQTLQTAQELVLAEGLVVSMDHISLEYIIAQAGVPRSAVHRLWPKKEEFFGELLVLLAKRREASPSVFDPETLIEAVRTLKGHKDQLATAPGRKAALVEVCRRGAMRNFEGVIARDDWKTYLALSATAMSFEDPIRRNLQTAIAESERDYVIVMSHFYEYMARIMGREIRPQFSSESLNRPALAYLAATGAAAMEGMVLRSGAFSADRELLPEISTTTEPVDPFDTGIHAKWNGPSLNFTATLLAMTRPIDDFSYNSEAFDGNIADIERMIAEMQSALQKTGPTDHS
ncbi:hypothetical protein BKP42_44790 [Rhodococcus erythropolis]|nr:hypothetical protein BKP42_44790 [Rhodococcus erythropolis]